MMHMHWRVCICVCVSSETTPSYSSIFSLCTLLPLLFLLLLLLLLLLSLSSALTPLVSHHRWCISPGYVLSTSRPPRCTAASESPVVSTAWRCSSGAPSSCPTMMISFMEAAPVLYAQVQEHPANLSFSFILSRISLICMCAGHAAALCNCSSQPLGTEELGWSALLTIWGIKEHYFPKSWDSELQVTRAAHLCTTSGPPCVLVILPFDGVTSFTPNEHVRGTVSRSMTLQRDTHNCSCTQCKHLLLYSYRMFCLISSLTG